MCNYIVHTVHLYFLNRGKLEYHMTYVKLERLQVVAHMILHKCYRTIHFVIYCAGERKAVREMAFARGYLCSNRDFKLSQKNVLVTVRNGKARQHYYLTVFSGLFSEFLWKETLFSLTSNSSAEPYGHELLFLLFLLKILMRDTTLWTRGFQPNRNLSRMSIYISRHVLQREMQRWLQCFISRIHVVCVCLLRTHNMCMW